MNKHTVEILNSLIDSYENSSGFKTGFFSKSVSLKKSLQSKFFNTVFDKGFMSFDDYEEMTHELKTLEETQLISLKRNKYNKENIASVILNIDNVDRVYNLLNRVPKKDILTEIVDYLNTQYDGSCSVCKAFINKEINLIKDDLVSTYPTIKDYSDIMDCVNYIYLNDEPIMAYELSAKLYNDTKYFSKHLETKIANFIRTNDEKFTNVFDDKLLFKELGVNQNSTYVLIKNKLIFKLNDQIIDLNKMGFEFSLSDKMIENLEILSSDIDEVLTVENLTTFKTIESNSLVIFLSGFHNHTKRLLLKKLYEKFPEATYYHFGDIDVGGFRIFEDLKAKTGIPFKPYMMGIEELKKGNVNYKSLTDFDRKSLQSMLEDAKYSLFHSTISYMLDNNIKLEQENLDNE